MTAQQQPPMRPSNEATAEQLEVARSQGDAYGRAMQAMAEEDGAETARAGDLVIAFVNEEAEGMYALEGDRLVWREAAEEANVHLEVAVADAGDGRFVPGLSVSVELARDGGAVLHAELPFLWHPFLHHYGANARVPDTGPYDVTVRVGPAQFMRHDPVNGRRYAQPVDVHFAGVRLSNGRKPSPSAQPRGAAAPTVAA
ncbi:Fe2+ transport protein [Micromonospora pattaloongensis]|uniref:Fe2+ transport protein n=1 Tax=Micromonospora pattaloongensis TaxID=405436 RepID=A0A1H3R3U6_9ACTN|nr:iron transporter [Micromonospora pattaloongensis]SDZ20464.1 Fe2+ transport protein [Micromonospora pattaloongensis]